MRILFCLGSFNVSDGHSSIVTGGTKSASYLINKLCENNTVQILCNNDTKGRYVRDKLVIQSVPLKKFPKLVYLRALWEHYQRISIILDEVKIFSPDIIIAQGFVVSSAIIAAKRCKIPSIVFLRAYENIYNNVAVKNHVKNNYELILKWLVDSLQIPIRLLLKYENIRLLKMADNIIVNSKFMKNFYRDLLMKNTEVIYPFVNKEKYKITKNSKKYITFIKPTNEKGIEIFIKIVKSMPTKQFLCVGHTSQYYKEKILKLVNVNYLEQQKDMKKVYSETKILLIPSTWNEPFGRVGLEAMLNGIPVIATNRGGIPEVLGKAGVIIQNYKKIENWTKAINRLDQDGGYYKCLSSQSTTQAKNFDDKEQYMLFEAIMKKV